MYAHLHASAMQLYATNRLIFLLVCAGIQFRLHCSVCADESQLFVWRHFLLLLFPLARAQTLTHIVVECRLRLRQ